MTYLNLFFLISNSRTYVYTANWILQAFPTSCFLNLLLTIIISRELIELDFSKILLISTKKGGSKNEAYFVLSVSGKQLFLFWFTIHEISTLNIILVQKMKSLYLNRLIVKK